MITWKQYSNRMISLNMQFDMAQKTLSEFKGTPEAVERYVAEELESIRHSIRESAEKSGADPTTTWAFSDRSVKPTLPGRLGMGHPSRHATATGSRAHEKAPGFARAPGLELPRAVPALGSSGLEAALVAPSACEP